MKVVTLKALPREPKGTGAARRVRHEGQLPAVVYGEGENPRHILLETRTFRHALDHGARVIDLEMDNVGSSRVLLKDVQFDALGAKVLHADFQRLHPDRKIHLGVPLTLEGLPKGVQDGGVLTVLSSTIEVRCLPADIPETIVLDISALQLGSSVHAGDVALPENVELAAEADQVLLSVAIPRGVGGEGEGEGEAEGDAEAAEGASEESAD